MDLSMANHHMMTFILAQICAFFSTMNMLQKSYEIVYIFWYPLPPSYVTLSHKWKMQVFLDGPLSFVITCSHTCRLSTAGSSRSRSQSSSHAQPSHVSVTSMSIHCCFLLSLQIFLDLSRFFTRITSMSTEMNECYKVQAPITSGFNMVLSIDESR